MLKIYYGAEQAEDQWKFSSNNFWIFSSPEMAFLHKEVN